jgi:hypothetical protein
LSIGTAGSIVTKALRLLTVLDHEEGPTPTMLTQGAEALSDMLRHTYGDATASFQVDLVWYTLPANQDGFTIGTAQPTYHVQHDVKKLRAIRVGEHDAQQGRNVTRRELRPSTLGHVFQVMVAGDTPTRYVTREQSDGSLLVNLWPAPASVALLLQLEIGKRVPVLSGPGDEVPLPPDAIEAASYLLAKKLRTFYGIALSDIQDVIAEADRYDSEWRTFARQDNTLRLRRRPA